MKLTFMPLVLVLTLGAFGTACNQDAPAGADAQNDAVPAPAEPAGTPANHAAADVVPGSHEDWCREHQVPESQCARCNPALVAAFKATGDWCDEHGVPESQCRLCNPSLKIERPPKASGAE
jgi:hypothetical protein